MFYLTTHSTHLYLRLYGFGHMVKDHSDSERGNLHAFVTPVVEHLLEREVDERVHHEGSIALTTEIHLKRVMALIFFK